MREERAKFRKERKADKWNAKGTEEDRGRKGRGKNRNE